ncbi:MAG TPA: hypothetical protein VK186_22935 [Candidatus Deferrimicrobium sp.]|nr:hypothetical protein [Candidatus Deferrimicrobium sp.]
MKKILIFVITVILFGTMIFAEKQEKPKPPTQQKQQPEKTTQAPKTVQTSKDTSNTAKTPTTKAAQNKPATATTATTATTAPADQTKPATVAKTNKTRRPKQGPKTTSSTSATPATPVTPAASTTSAAPQSQQTLQTQPTQSTQPVQSAQPAQQTQPVSTSCRAIPTEVEQGGTETDIGRIYISRDFVHADIDYKKGNYYISIIEKDGSAWFKIFNNKKELLFTEMAVIKAYEAKVKRTKIRVRKEFLKDYEYFRVTVIKPDNNLILYFMIKQKEVPAPAPTTTTKPAEKTGELKIEEIEL